MEKISHDELKRILHYDPETGIFCWCAPRPKVQVGQRAGYVHHKGYRHLELKGKHYSEHRLAWFYVTAQWPRDQIDHINCDRADNRFDNLREATNGQNQANTGTRNKTGYRGVFYHSWLTENPYEARITHSRKTQSLGCFPTAEQASAVYIEASKRLFGQFSAPNLYVAAAT